MNVALLTNFIAPYRLPLLEELRKQVVALRVFLSTPMETDRTWAVDWGGLDVRVQRSISWSSRYRDPLGFNRRLQIHFPYDTIPLLRRFRPDIVISAELGMRSAQAALYCTLHPKTRFLVWATLSEHSERNWGRTRNTLRQAILSRADGVLVNGESGARYIKQFGIPDRRIYRINQPIDVSLFNGKSSSRQQDAGRRMLYAGALTSRKGLVGFMNILLPWAARHPANPIEIIWLGDGDQRPALAAMDLPPHVTQRFLGNQPYDALPEIYAQADMLFFPSLMDEWGLVVNEAMASNVPVIGSIYSQAVEELVEDDVTGWTFDPVVPTSVQTALDRAFAASPDKLRAMGQAARCKIETLTPASASQRIVRAMQDIDGNTVRGGRRLRERRVHQV